MNSYEALFVLKLETDDETKKNITSIHDIFKKHGVVISQEENWGKKQIAYPIKKDKEGTFYKVNFEANPSSIREVESAFKLNTRILRVMIVKREEAKK